MSRIFFLSSSVGVLATGGGVSDTAVGSVAPSVGVEATLSSDILERERSVPYQYAPIAAMVPPAGVLTILANELFFEKSET